MADKKKKRDKPLKVDMEFDEFVERVVRVDKSEIEANIGRKKASNAQNNRTKIFKGKDKG